MEMSPSPFSLFPFPESEAGSTGLCLGLVSGPFSVSAEPESLGLDLGGAVFPPEEPKEVVQATMSRSRRMCATARSSE